MKRCPGCGGFYAGEECPNLDTIDHAPITWQSGPTIIPTPEKPDTIVGRIVTHNGGVYVVVSAMDEDGRCGLSPLYERVRVNLDDVEEI